MLDVDDSHNKIIWPHLGRADNCFWVLCYSEAGRHRIVIAEAARVMQEGYVVPEVSKAEDLLTVFTSSEAAILYIGAIGRELGSQHNDNLRFVALSEELLLELLANLDRQYESRQTALRVDICELKNRELRREILYSRQIPKH